MTGPSFTPILDHLTPPQRRLWEELPALPEGFVLYGGTALSLHLGHRQSADFDFFGSARFEPQGLIDELPLLQGAEVVQRSPSSVSLLLDRDGPVRLSLFGVPRLGRVEDALLAAPVPVRVASLSDLAGTKAAVVQQRAEARDYLDLDALIRHGVGLDVALAAAQVLYGASFNPQVTLKALSYYDDGNLRHLDVAVRRRLLRAVRAVDLDTLPQLEPRTR